MGSRGASSGSGGGGGGSGTSSTFSGGGGGGQFGGFKNLQQLISAMQNSMQSNTNQGKGGQSLFHDGEGNATPDFTDNGNPALMKWQGQTDDSKAAKYLAKMGKMTTPGQDSEGYAYYQSAFQNMVIDQNLNAPVYARMDNKSFDAYCKANNLEPIYRGWSGGTASKDRFENAQASHTGTGMYGEGYYFGSKSTASGYSGGSITKAALSPNARVVDINVVQSAIANSGASKAFMNSGKSTTGHFSKNMGEAQMALKMGYNVIRTSWSYVVLTRDAVVVTK